MAFDAYPQVNVTPAEYAQSDYLRHTWASFAKDPDLGPGWNQVGSAGGFVVSTQGNGGPGDDDPRGVSPAPADLDLAVIGGHSGDVGGVQMVRRAEVESKCGIFLPLYKVIAEGRGDGF